jgi:hypothetical protein
MILGLNRRYHGVVSKFCTPRILVPYQLPITFPIRTAIYLDIPYFETNPEESFVILGEERKASHS